MSPLNPETGIANTEQIHSQLKEIKASLAKNALNGHRHVETVDPEMTEIYKQAKVNVTNEIKGLLTVTEEPVTFDNLEEASCGNQRRAAQLLAGNNTVFTFTSVMDEDGKYPASPTSIFFDEVRRLLDQEI